MFAPCENGKLVMNIHVNVGKNRYVLINNWESKMLVGEELKSGTLAEDG